MKNIIITFFTKLFTPEGLTALGTISSSVLALWFGIFGNRETRILIKKIENELDQEAFKFLTEIPNKITGTLNYQTHYGTNKTTTREFISDFERKILEHINISKSTKRKYRRYIRLAEEYSQCTVSTDDAAEKKKKIFYKLKKDAEDLSKKIDAQTKLDCMRKIWVYEAGIFWDKTIYLINPILKDGVHPKIFIYSDIIPHDSRKSDANARKYVQEYFNRQNVSNQSNTYYMNETDCSCEVLYPSEYELVNRNDKHITIKFQDKYFELDYNRPYCV